MALFIFKTEPSECAFADLSPSKPTQWDGVANPGARAHLRTCREGDEVFIYHTGDEKAIVGLARVVGSPYEDPKQKGLNDAGQPKAPVVDLVAVKAVPKPVSLAAVKADAKFKDFALVKQARLSVMPVPAAIEKALRKLAGL